jgi:dolichol-phosphate mannosyltransferase
MSTAGKSRGEHANADVSVVSPVYRCRDCIDELHRQLEKTFKEMGKSFELILVNDGCPERSWETIQALAQRDPRVKGVNLSRNFGQHYAIAAGVHHANGDWVVVMDCDLQDRPAEIPNLFKKAQEGFDIVYALRNARQDPWLKLALARIFSLLYNLLSPIRIEGRASNFSIVSRKVAETYGSLKELNRSYHLNLRWMGYRYAYLEVAHGERFAGRSAYNFGRSFRLAVESVTSQSNKPLLLSIRAGFLMAGAAALMGLYMIFRYYAYHVAVTGWTSVIVSLYFIGGLILTNLGVLGLYLGKIFDETKDRPLYVVRETVNFRQDAK